ncbi:MAG: MarR family transcriptional regulator [Hyphomonadaceae bacterium]|nr:MarR family transcriptional regulator [Hyphomonadaceae bacterium]MBX3511819.1 MarR family transcriptional regulator [Hyphomonadaceae bacterium]
MAEPELDRVAERLHAAAIRLLRNVRSADAESGVSPAKLSALSVLAFAGPRSLSELARAEQLSAPTMSKTVADLERDGLVAKTPDPRDRRGVVIEVTAQGRALMERGRERRLAMLRARLAGFSAEDLRTLEAAAQLMLRASAD